MAVFTTLCRILVDVVDVFRFLSLVRRRDLGTLPTLQGSVETLVCFLLFPCRWCVHSAGGRDVPARK